MGTTDSNQYINLLKSKDSEIEQIYKKHKEEINSLRSELNNIENIRTTSIDNQNNYDFNNLLTTIINKITKSDQQNHKMLKDQFTVLNNISNSQTTTLNILQKMNDTDNIITKNSEGERKNKIDIKKVNMDNNKNNQIYNINDDLNTSTNIKTSQNNIIPEIKTNLTKVQTLENDKLLKKEQIDFKNLNIYHQ